MNETKVFDFMNLVKQAEVKEKQNNAFKNSHEYKLNLLNKEVDHAKDCCANAMFAKLYKDATPLGKEYKMANNDAMNDEMSHFMAKKAPNGLLMYIRDSSANGNICCKKILEAVDKIVNDEYKDKAMNLDDYTADDIVFRANPDFGKKIDVANENLGLTDLSQVISDNVKTQAMAEIQRAKDEKSANNAIEQELANDMKVTSESAIDYALQLKGLKNVRTYQPSLFEGIMIGNMNTYESSESVYTFDAMHGYYTEQVNNDYESRTSSPEEYAFIESVKEYTKLSILKALNLEKFDLPKIRNLASTYASN